MLKRLAIIIALLSAVYISSPAQEKFRIYDSRKEGPSRVRVTAYIPEEGDSLAAVIVCPGGSYFWLDPRSESKVTGEWLKSNGIAAFVLRYRTGGFWAFSTWSRPVFGGNQFPDMFVDIQQALRFLRENAEKFRIDPEKTGVMGFSAGGHLAVASGIYAGTDFSGHQGDSLIRPDFIAAIYPVVTMKGQYAHERSIRGLLGDNWKKERAGLTDSLSLEKHVTPDCPPVFLVNCEDDPTVRWQNSQMLDSALTAEGVQHKYIRYSTGGHGFGADEKKGSAESRQWKNEFLMWLKEVFN